MANSIRYIFFDCMETIVDLYELPSKRDYAFWAFSNSGVEHYWPGFDEFYMQYEAATNELDSSFGMYQEYGVIQRLELLVEHTKSIDQSRKDRVTGILYEQYWNTYKSKCYVKEEIKQVLRQLSNNYQLAIVSNFKVNDGIEQLLEINGVRGLFDIVVTSIRCGWRKPDPRIYELAMKQAGCRPEQILFVGDDYQCDYVAPRRMGMQSIWLDKKGAASPGIDKAADFGQLAESILK